MAVVKIVLVGDSNTQYTSAAYGDLSLKLKTALELQYPTSMYNITNSAVGGSTSKTALDNFSTQVTPYTPDLLVFLHGGTNDGYYGYGSSIYDPAAYETRMRSYKSLVYALPVNPLWLLITMPAHAEQADGWTYYRNIVETGPIRQKMQALATEWNLPITDWHGLMVANANWRSAYLVDGVHVNPAAKDVLVTGIIAALSPRLASDGSVVISAPTLTLNSPTLTTTTSTATLTGTMSTGATISVTGATAVVSYPTTTTWRAELSGLIAGVNNITVTASKDGLETSAVAVVTRIQPPGQVRALIGGQLKQGQLYYHSQAVTLRRR